MIIFKRIEKAMKTIQYELLISKEDEEKRILAKQKLEALNEIVNYVNSFEWLKHKKSKEKIKAFLMNRYDYKKVATLYKTSLNSIQSSVSYASKMVENKIGRNAVDLILKGDIEVALTQFRVGTASNKIADLFLNGVWEQLPKAKKSDAMIDLMDFKRELSFLEYFTKRNIESKVNSLDKDKVAMLLFILESTDGKYAFEREVLYRYINGRFSNIDELMVELNQSNPFRTTH